MLSSTAAVASSQDNVSLQYAQFCWYTLTGAAVTLSLLIWVVVIDCCATRLIHSHPVRRRRQPVHAFWKASATFSYLPVLATCIEALYVGSRTVFFHDQGPFDVDGWPLQLIWAVCALSCALSSSWFLFHRNSGVSSEEPSSCSTACAVISTMLTVVASAVAITTTWKTWTLGRERLQTACDFCTGGSYTMWNQAGVLTAVSIVLSLMIMASYVQPGVSSISAFNVVQTLATASAAAIAFHLATPPYKTVLHVSEPIGDNAMTHFFALQWTALAASLCCVLERLQTRVRSHGTNVLCGMCSISQRPGRQQKKNRETASYDTVGDPLAAAEDNPSLDDDEVLKSGTGALANIVSRLPVLAAKQEAEE